MPVEPEAAELVVAEARAEPRGVIRISCPIALINFQFEALIARFMAINPGVEVHLEGTTAGSMSWRKGSTSPFASGFRR